MINVELKGGAVKEFENGTTPAEIAKSIGAGLYKSVCCAKVDGDLCDLRTPLEKDCKVELLTFDNVDGQHLLLIMEKIFRLKDMQLLLYIIMFILRCRSISKRKKVL